MVECRLVTQGKLALLQLPAEWQHPTIKLDYNPDLVMREKLLQCRKNSRDPLQVEPPLEKRKVLRETSGWSPE